MKKILILLTCILSVNCLAKNSFLVAPGIVDFDLKKPTTQSFIITNDGDEPIRLNIKPVYFPIDDPTLGLGRHILAETREAEDITQFIRVSPKRLSLQPGQRRDIRVSIRVDKERPPGSYRSHLLVQMLETAQVIKTSTGDGVDDVGMEIKVKMETAVAIYGTMGEGNAELAFTCEQDNNTGKIKLNVTNNTSWRYDGSVNIKNSVAPISTIFEQRLISLRGSENSFLLNSPYSKGETYKIAYAHFATPDEINKIDCPRPPS